MQMLIVSDNIACTGVRRQVIFMENILSFKIWFGEVTQPLHVQKTQKILRISSQSSVTYCSSDSFNSLRLMGNSSKGCCTHRQDACGTRVGNGIRLGDGNSSTGERAHFSPWRSCSWTAASFEFMPSKAKQRKHTSACTVMGADRSQPRLQGKGLEIQSQQPQLHQKDLQIMRWKEKFHLLLK